MRLIRFKHDKAEDIDLYKDKIRINSRWLIISHIKRENSINPEEIVKTEIINDGI